MTRVRGGRGFVPVLIQFSVDLCVVQIWLSLPLKSELRCMHQNGDLAQIESINSKNYTYHATIPLPFSADFVGSIMTPSVFVLYQSVFVRI